MKISISVANYNIALSQIVFRGNLEPIFEQISGLGYQGVDVHQLLRYHLGQ